MKTAPKVFRFARNELDLGRYELRRGGRRLPLSRMPMEFLILLLERRGQLVTREEIVARLWPDPHSVDIVQGINSAVNRIRAVLNDDAAKPRFIETVVGKGYRFIADVEVVAEEQSPQTEVTKDVPEKLAKQVDTVAFICPPSVPDAVRHGSRTGAWRIAISVGLLLVIATASWLWKGHSNPTAERALPERTLPEYKPVFRQITTLVPENRATAAAIAPNGRSTVYANVDGIFLRTERGETTALRAPANFIVDRLTWFPDLTKILASGFSSETNRPSLWTISVTGAPARSIRSEAREGTPSPDGSRVVFCSSDRSAIWTMGASGEDPRIFVEGSTQDRFEFVFWSADGRRLNLERHRNAVTGAEWTYETVDAATGRIVRKRDSLWMRSAAVLGDGRVLFLRWDNEDFTSSNALWELSAGEADGTANGRGRKLAEFSGEGGTLLDLSATTDGKRALLLRRSDQNSIYVGDLGPPPLKIANVRRLTLDERNNYPHSWTADSQFVIFESNRNGNYDLFRQGLHERTAETIVSTAATEMLPQLASGGRFVLYAAHAPENEQPWYYHPRTYKLMRVAVNGGTPEEVPIGGNVDEFRCASDTRHRCVLRSTEGQSRIYYELDPVRGKGRELARIRSSSEVLGDWDVSPDGTEVAIPNHDARGGRIRVVALEPNDKEPREHEVILPEVSGLRGLVWAADGRHWFASIDTSIGNQLLYVNREGGFHSLGDIQGWAVPSPDGRHMAFLNRTIASNVWLLQLR